MLLLFLIAIDTLIINLDLAKELAEKNNPSYKISALLYTQGKLGVARSVATNIFNPSANVSYSEIAPYKGYSFTLGLDQPVFDLGNTAKLLQSNFSMRAKKYSKEEAKNSLFYTVEVCYLSALKMQKLLEVREKTVERANENLRVVQHKMELGEASRLDLLNAMVYLDRSKLELTEAKKDYEVSKRVLLNVIGIYEDTELSLAPVKIEEEYHLLPLDTLLQISMKRRPKIKATKEEVKEAKLGFWGSFLSFLPQVSYKWRFQYDSEEWPSKFSEIHAGASKSQGWSGVMGINLFTYPLDVWTYKTELNKKQLNLLSEELTLLKELKEAWLELNTAIENLELAKTMLQTAEEADRLAQKQYELGLISSLDMFKAEAERLDAELTYISTLYNYRLAKTKLEFITGGK